MGMVEDEGSTFVVVCQQGERHDENREPRRDRREG